MILLDMDCNEEIHLLTDILQYEVVDDFVDELELHIMELGQKQIEVLEGDELINE